MVDTLVFRLWRSVARFFHGVADDEAGKCEYCRAEHPAHSGLRQRGRVYCDDECARLDFERLG